MGLIICLLALYTLPSCEDPNRIGLDVQPEEDLINAIYLDNLPVNTYTMMRDSVYTYSSGGYLVGSYLDPQFGRTTAEAYGQIYTTSISFPAGETRTLDSIVMILDYAYNYYGDTSKIQHFKIYQLQDTLTAPLYANSEKAVKAGAALLGETSFKPNPGGTDAVARIKLNPALGNQILNKQTWTYTELSRDFPSWFVIKPDIDNNTCILDFAILKNETTTDSKSEVKIYYKGTTGVTTTAKTLSLNIINGNRFNQIKGNRAGTFLSNVSAPNLVSSSTTNQLVAVQSGTGIRGYLNFPFLDNIPQYFNGANKIKIVKAELELKSQYATGEMIAPAALYLSQPREKYPQTRVPLIDVDTTIGLKTESYMYNSSGTTYYTASRTILSKQDTINHLYTYTLPLTSYFNDVLQGQVDNNGLIITSASTRTSVSRLLFGDQNNTTNPLRLKLYYIKLD
ncbi:protein of unknown function [Flexibacter flexilis DSM 6793]|uniref:DUF4270 domain-containing protein n=1 Tax=Flexibacter flexilis DSM 6793 TaxID=927664 RepID=A0A1I1LVI2_9BACT|nr:DUF4270 family protein [Flexibacter flexilis]SFC77089.1 protein of unknown function [Flexibacter flexilis DSM 6793]